MLKELIETNLVPMLAKLNTIFQREATQAICKKNNYDADGQPIPKHLTKHLYKESMTSSKETRDDTEMLALIEVARKGDLTDQERCTKNNSDQATLNIKRQ